MKNSVEMLLAFLHLAFLASVVASNDDRGDSFRGSQWQKMDGNAGHSMKPPGLGELPSYCAVVKGSGPLRRIPTLTAETQKKKPRLLQAQVVIRHGARTPTSNHNCWNGYYPKWNCKVQEAVVGIDPRPGHKSNVDTEMDGNGLELHSRGLQQQTHINELDEYKHGDHSTRHSHLVFSTESRTFMFPKVYDVHPDANVFHGTCMEGQLIDDGFNQHLDNGRELAEVYFQANDSYRVPYPGAPPLIDLKKATADAERSHKTRHQRKEDAMSAPEATRFPVVRLPELYFRSTDMQRTRLSGATLLSSAIRHTVGTDADRVHWDIPLHTMDLDYDTMAVSDKWCPALSKIQAAAKNSTAFRRLMDNDVKIARAVAKEVDRNPDEYEAEWRRGVAGDHLVDCLMTSVCSGRGSEIPEGLRPYTKLYNDAMTAVDQETNFVYMWNNSMYSRALASQLMSEVKTNIMKAYIHFSESKKSHRERLTELKYHFGEEELVEIVHNEMATKLAAMESLYSDGGIQAKLDEPPPALALFSGHDTTVMPFLASMGKDVFSGTWPPYASIIVFELLELESELFFRMVYNGEILHSRIPGCHDGHDLCKVKNFFRATDWARPGMRCKDVDLSETGEVKSETPISIKQMIATKIGVFAESNPFHSIAAVSGVAGLLLGLVFGVLGVAVLNKRHLVNRKYDPLSVQGASVE
eukprot:GHVN01067210.1.p1 GENE.GHVN01067210.1~~GHVN01067210.1.p1  ORF type:complete len:695 (+),score=76.36 GHVN01067210.1:7954-10038(+)